MNNNKPNGPTYYSSISELCFYVLSSEENLIESNVNITNKEVMKGDRPMIEGIYDAHMGTTDHLWYCATCGNRKTICPGHPGSIDLKYPVKSPMFRDELLKWLKVVCYHCGNLLMENKKTVAPENALRALAKNIRSVKKCPKCNKPHWQVSKDKARPAVFLRTSVSVTGVKTEHEFFNHQIKAVINKIRDETVIKMARPLKCHPKKFILTTVRAPPNTIRPDIRRVGGSRSSNSDTTSLLKTLVEINDTLPDEIPEDVEHIRQDLRDMYFNLDMTYYAMIRGAGGGDIKLVTNTNKPPVAIAERFPKKEGRIRRNLMGKRVAYMIRSVITGDSRIKINEVGIPIEHARNLEIPETVTEQNYSRLMIYYLNKNVRYPGCKHIIKKSDGHSYRIEHLDKNYKLQVGDKILRDMITGDVVILNRQPSLLFASMANMRVIVMETSLTIRLNPSALKGFNADFDGDTMNCLVPQSIQSRNECLKISKFSRWFVSPQDSKPMVGAFQDGLIGIAEFTKHGLIFNKWHAMQVLSDIDHPTFDYHMTNKSYTNRQLVSLLLPKINIIGKSPKLYRKQYAHLLHYDPEDIKVSIKRGQLQSGVLDKATAGQGTMGSIFHIIANEYGSDKALEVVYNFQQMTNQYFLNASFTVGINDLNISLEAARDIKGKIAGMILESRKITQQLNNGKLIAPLGMSLLDYYETEQTNALSPGDDFINPIFNDIDLNSNGMAKLILCGSKGDLPNFIAINGAIGLQTINGKRFGPQAGWGRTSPYFLRYDTEPQALGYLSMSYREGINSNVYHFIAGSARHSLISIALSTSITGYQNRISIKNLESILIDNLRKCVKGLNVVQTLYGECGVDPSRTEKVKFNTVLISDEEFTREYKCELKHVDKKFRNNNTRDLLNAEFTQLTADREQYRNIHDTIENHNPGEYIASNTKQLPVNIFRLISDVVYNYSEMTEEMPAVARKLDPVKTINTVKQLCDDLPYIFMNDAAKRRRAFIPKRYILACTFIKILLRSYLCMRYLLKHGVHDELLNIIIKEIQVKYKKSLIDYGTAAGILAVQCVSEPMTQFMLDSKHSVGVQGGAKTSTVDRIKEILGARTTEGMKNPSMTIMVKPEYQNDKIKVREISNHLEMLRFNRFIKKICIFFEEFGKPAHHKYAHEATVIKEIIKQNYGIKKPNDLTKWCIYYEIDKEELILKSMRIETIILAIYKKYTEQLFIIYTPENAKKLFIRCYLRSGPFKHSQNFYEANVYPLMNDIKQVVVRGINGLLSTRVIDIIKNIKQPDGSMQRKKIYGISAYGTNLVKVLANEYIDPYRTQSDSVHEIEQVFGVIAARTKILNELVNILSPSLYIHCGMFADEMTYLGMCTNIQNTGLQKRELSNVSLRLSFQTAVQVIQAAAINGMTDKIKGISGPLVIGSNPKNGTVYNSFIVNDDFVKKNMKTIADTIDDL